MQDLTQILWPRFCRFCGKIGDSLSNSVDASLPNRSKRIHTKRYLKCEGFLSKWCDFDWSLDEAIFRIGLFPLRAPFRPFFAFYLLLAIPILNLNRFQAWWVCAKFHCLKLQIQGACCLFNVVASALYNLTSQKTLFNFSKFSYKLIITAWIRFYFYKNRQNFLLNCSINPKLLNCQAGLSGNQLLEPNMLLLMCLIFFLRCGLLGILHSVPDLISIHCVQKELLSWPYFWWNTISWNNFLNIRKKSCDHNTGTRKQSLIP